MTQLPPQDPAFPASTPPPPPPPGQTPPPGPSAPPGPPPPFGNEPPPPAGFGAPPPAPGKPKNTRLIVVLGVLVVAAVIGAIALVASGGDDDKGSDNAGRSSSGGGNPEAEAEDVALGFISAEVDEDCDAMVGLMSSRFIETRGGESEAVDACVSEYEGYGGITYDDGSLKMTSSGDETITFEAEETLGGEPYDATYNLIKEDGKWRIDSLS